MESGLRDTKKFGFWDNQNSEPVIILNDSTIYIGLEKSKLFFEPLDLDDSKLNELTPSLDCKRHDLFGRAKWRCRS